MGEGGAKKSEEEWRAGAWEMLGRTSVSVCVKGPDLNDHGVATGRRIKLVSSHYPQSCITGSGWHCLSLICLLLLLRLPYSCEATAIIVLIILSLYGGSAAQKTKHTLYGGSAAQKTKHTVFDYCSLEALDTHVSMVLASMTSWGRSFQSLMILGRNEYYWYWVPQCGCENCWLCLRC